MISPVILVTQSDFFLRVCGFNTNSFNVAHLATHAPTETAALSPYVSDWGDTVL